MSMPWRNSSPSAMPRFTAGRAFIVSSQRLRFGNSFDVLSLPFPAIDPADERHVGDRIFAGDERPIFQADVHHAVKPVDLVHRSD